MVRFIPLEGCDASRSGWPMDSSLNFRLLWPLNLYEENSFQRSAPTREGQVTLP
jgi:hypothetical protein